MKIKEVTYSKTFGMPDKKDPFEKIMLVGELEEGDTPRQALYALRKEAHDFHFESNKAAEKQVIENKPLPAQEREAQTIADIYSCTSPLVLEAVYKKLANNYPAIKAAYDQQLNKLNGL